MATKTYTTSKESTQDSKIPTSDFSKFETQIYGTQKGEYLYGNGGDNYIYGGGGGDTFIGDAGADQLHGGVGDIDTVDYSSSTTGVKVNLTKGYGSGGDADGDSYYFINNITGSNYRDHLYGDDSVNVLDGRNGNDYLNGYGGNDTLIGGYGDDTLVGGAGGDKLYGGSGSDTASYADATSGVEINLASGSAAGSHADGDTFSSIENVTGSRYGDGLQGDNGANVLTGGNGDDTLSGLGGDDTLYGGSGDDVLIAGRGLDIVNGGAGSDEVSYANEVQGVRINLEDGYGGTINSSTLAPNLDSSDIDEYYSIEDATGTNYRDTIIGNSGANYLKGLDGDDYLSGLAGSDILDGGKGQDTATYRTSNAAVTIDLAAGTGSGGHADGDKLLSIENITGSEMDSNVLRGDDMANVISSLGNDDIVEARGGDDTIWVNGENTQVLAGAGNDEIHVSFQDNIEDWPTIGSSSLYIDGGKGTDTLYTPNYVAYGQTPETTVDLQANTMTRSGWVDRKDGYVEERIVNDKITDIENVVGSNNIDNLFGDKGANELAGKGGDDTLYGRGGSDTLIGGGGADYMDGGAGIDTAVYRSGQDINVSLRTGTGFGGEAEGDTLINIENVVGGLGNDIIEGDAGDNVLSGGDGNDILNGGGGNDVLTGDAGADTFIFDLDYFGSDDGTITDFEAGTDQIDFSGLTYATNASQVFDNLEQVGSDVVFDYGQSSITIQNTQVASLTSDDFLF